MKKILLTALLAVVPLILPAASADFRFRHFSVENGLSSNAVRAIMQDKYGFMWIGTDDGLNRYDGTTIKIYKLNPPGVNDYISSLYDTADKIWVGTETGIYMYDYETEIFKPFKCLTPKGDSIHTNVNHIAEDRDGNLWFSTVGQGIFKYNRSKHYLEHYPFKDASGLMASVLVDSENQIWAVSNWGSPAVSRLNKAENTFEAFRITYEKGVRYDSNALVMLEDSEHTLWLGTWECGLQKIDRYTGRATTFLHPAGSKGAMHIHSLMEYAPHQLLIGSDDGLLLFNTHTNEYRLFTEDETSPYSLSNRFVYPIVKDREGGVWIGTFYGGVNYLSPNTGQFESFAHSRFSNSVNGTVIGRFCEDASGQIWIASDDGGLNRYSPKEKRFTHYLPQERKNSLSYHNVHALCIDGDDLWIGTYTGGVNVLNTKTGMFRIYTTRADDPATLDGSSSYAILKDREGRIWVASMSGVNLYNREKDNFIRMKDLGAWIMDIDQDAGGNIWFSTQGKGLFKYNPDKQVWTTYAQNTPGTLINDQVNCMLIDGSGNMWVGTMNGLCKYNVKEDRFEAVPLEVPSRAICGIVEDQRVLWLTTTKGLVRYVPGENCQVFTRSDGLQSEQFLVNAALKTSDGKIYVGSVNGFNAFYPYQIKTNKVLPPVVITGLEVFNKEIRIGDKLLPKALNRLAQLELSYKDYMFSLLFASLSYCTPEKNRYAYKLEGFDKDWNYVGSQTKATYTNLPAGSYTFKVKATNNDGIWSDREASLRIIIHPPFYWSTAFKILYAILICITLTFFIRFLLRRTEKKHTAEINRLNMNKEKEVHEAKIKFFTMIAHEIRTPVSLIIAPLEKIIKSAVPMPAALRNELNIIDRNSQRLLFLVNQLLDFRKVEQEGMAIRYVPQQIRPLLEAVCERFKPFITQHGVHLEVTYPEAGFTAMVDSEAVTKLISNLLTNAVKYTTDRILLSCIAHPEQGTFTIRVTDNGIGISEEEQRKIFKPFYQSMDNKPGTGIGLSIVKNIVELHNGCIEVESEVDKGSSFIVTLPIEQANGATQTEAMHILNPAIPEGILLESLPVATSGSKPVMLIVDDNAEMLNFLSSNFSAQYVILTAEDGVEALEILKTNEVMLVVSDWMMPRMDGVEFCKTLRADSTISHVPFILLTAKADMNSKIEGMDCGADAYIEKPFSVQYLEACIKNLLDLRSLLRRKFSKMPMVPLNSIAGNRADDKFLTRINEIIEQNFSNPELTVDFLAERLCISRSGLFAKIKTLADVTPNELIQIVRLKKAAALLAENRYRINEVCYMVGFNNPSYFAKCFQKQFGIKPGEFAGGKSNGG